MGLKMLLYLLKIFIDLHSIKAFMIKIGLIEIKLTKKS